MISRPRSYPQNDVQNNKNFTNTFLYDVLSCLFDRGYLALRKDIDIGYGFEI